MKKFFIVLLSLLLIFSAMTAVNIVSLLPEIDSESFYYQLTDPNEESGFLILDSRDYFDSLDDLGPYVLDALLAIEDQRFYEHSGVDPIRIAGALFANFKNGFGAEGGSTISQQLVKITYLDQREKTLERKITEAITALKIEREYSKEDILYAYLNKVYFGDSGYGIKKASKYYFDKEPKGLTLEESSIITGIIQNPTMHSPSNRQDSMIKRAKLVLTRMEELGKITVEEEEIARSNLDSVKYIKLRE